tara:strand:- start:380 stop:595 length:216 start_codon:yes stop_codon:yes gene_type:complete
MYLEQDFFKENILKWNTACDLMGIKQCLWVLKIDMKYEKSLIFMEPQQWKKLILKLRHRYNWLKKIGRIDG